MTLLSMQNVSLSFGGLMAVNDVSLDVQEGEIRALIGPNGAGKSTVFNLINGIYKPSQGHILFQGRNITAIKPYRITDLGISRTFQNIRLFQNLTVLDNVRLGCHSWSKAQLGGALLGGKKVRSEERVIIERSLEALEFMHLSDKAGEQAKNLSYGDQRRLEISRALVSKPRLILLDEPAAGMNPQEKQALVQTIQKIRQLNITILLVEHDMKFVMGLSDLITVLDYGKKIAEGNPQEVRTNPDVIAAYLGKEVVKSA